MSNTVLFDNIGKTFPPDVVALHSIDLKIAEHERMVVVGPSGCGKSTLLRLVAGLEEPSRGSIHLFGKDASGIKPSEREVGMVFQNYALFPHLTSFDNMAYGLKARKRSQSEIRNKVEEVAKKLQVLDLLKRKPHQLSGGQRQRIALGRLLARDPKIHLFDEPLGNLDPQFRQEMRSELARLHSENPRTSLYVTHDQAEAMTLGQKICVLHEGEIIQTGTPDEIYSTPNHRFVAQFFGSPGADCIHGKIERNAQDLPEFVFHSFRLSIPRKDLPNGSITLGVRPEDWQVLEEGPGMISGSVCRVENLGDHRLIEIRVDEDLFFLKTTRTDLKAGHPILIAPDFNQAHWFERYTGKRIP